MGTRLAEHFLEKGERIRILALPSDRSPLADHDSVEMRFGDISNPDDLRGICEGTTTVYHLAAIILATDESLYEKINAQGTQNIISEARGAGVQHFIYVSSSSVAFPSTTPYSRSKRRAEETVRTSGLNFTIARPTLAYSPTGGQEFNILIDNLRRPPVIPVVGRGETKKRPVYLDDIIQGLIAIHGMAITHGKTYYLSGGEAISLYDFVRLCLDSIGRRRTPIVRVPMWIWLVLAKLAHTFMRTVPHALSWHMIATASQPVDLDPTRAEQDIGYCPRRVSEMLPRVMNKRMSG